MRLLFPWFLLGLAAVAIPIVIHLLQLRRPQRLLFTNTSFIQEIELVTMRRRNVRHLFILLARASGVMAMVLAFCQPYIPAWDVRGTGRIHGAGVLIDNSFSMQQRGGTDNSLFEEAVAQASALGKSIYTGAKLELLNVSAGSGSASGYQERIGGLRLSAQSSLSRITGEATARGSQPKSVYLFSDFQKTTFNASQLLRMGDQRELILAPIVGNKAGNVYVDSVWLDDAFVRLRTNVGLRVRLRNGGGLAVQNCPIKVFLGTRQVAAFRLTVGPGEAVISAVQVQIDSEALALGRVVTEDVPVRFDNTYYFTLQPTTAIRVVEIGSEPVAQQLYANEPLFNYSFEKPQRVNYGILRQANLVLVHELGGIDAGLRSGLRAVVQRGGSVVIVPAATVAGRGSYQQFFKELGLGAVQWEDKTAAPELREVAMPGAQEPFFRNVFGAQQRAVTMPRAAPVLRWSRTGTDILRLRDGESYLADFSSGTGKVYVFSAPFSKEYSDFASHALFVPVLYRMALLSYRDEQLPAYRLTQNAVALKLPASPNAAGEQVGRDEASFRLVKDSVTLIPGQRVVGQEVRLEVPVGMDAPGFYQVQQRGKVITTLAFNQDKRESELAAYSADELRQLVGPNRPNIRVLDGSVGGAELAKFQEAQTPQPLWRYFLALALACLLVEGLLLRFGGQRTGERKAQPAA